VRINLNIVSDKESFSFVPFIVSVELIGLLSGSSNRISDNERKIKAPAIMIALT
jgi:hypothetical protein